MNKFDPISEKRAINVAAIGMIEHEWKQTYEGPDRKFAGNILYVWLHVAGVSERIEFKGAEAVSWYSRLMPIPLPLEPLGRDLGPMPRALM